MLLLFVIGFIVFMIKIVLLAFRMAFSLTKLLLYVIFLPLVLVGMVFMGLVYAALPLLIIALLAAFLLPSKK